MLSAKLVNPDSDSRIKAPPCQRAQSLSPAVVTVRERYIGKAVVCVHICRTSNVSCKFYRSLYQNSSIQENCLCRTQEFALLAHLFELHFSALKGLEDHRENELPFCAHFSWSQLRLGLFQVTNAEVQNKCPTFIGGGCPYAGLAKEKKGIAGKCPAFAKGTCPFAECKSVGEFQNKFSEMRQHSKGDGAHVEFLKAVMLTSKEKAAELGRACPFFEKGCPFSHGEDIVSPVSAAVSDFPVISIDFSPSSLSGLWKSFPVCAVDWELQRELKSIGLCVRRAHSCWSVCEVQSYRCNSVGFHSVSLPRIRFEMMNQYNT